MTAGVGVANVAVILLLVRTQRLTAPWQTGDRTGLNFLQPVVLVVDEVAVFVM